MPLDDFKKPTRFTGGIAVGGDDLGDAIPQPAYFGVRLTATRPSRTIRLPAGSVIDYVRVTPATPTPSAGTVDVGPVATPDAWADGKAAFTADEDALAAAVVLSVDTDVSFVATSLDGDTLIQVRVQHPNIRV